MTASPLSDDGPAPIARPAEAAPRFTPTDGKLIPTLRQLWPYFWPAGRGDLRRRVVFSLALMLVAKVATIAIPYTFKWTTDALVMITDPGADPGTVPSLLIGAPVAAALVYGLARIVTAFFTQVREGIFAPVAMHAVRRLALETFEHIHRLSMRFHLERKTGGLTRVLERGRNAIEEIARLFMMTLLPTVVEFALVLGVLWLQFDVRYVIVVAVMIVIYVVFTVRATEWRIGIRKAMNSSDTDANAKAIDSLLNVETVKYFTAERREADRYDRAMEVYERESVKTYTSLAALNFGQAVIFSAGLAAAMAMAALDVLAGRASLGEFVMVNALLIQLSIPLNFMGMIYRDTKQGITDINMMYDLLSRDAEVADAPGAKPLAIGAGVVRFEDVRFHHQPERPILKGVSFEVPAGRTIAIVGPSGAGKSTISRLLFRFYDATGGRITIDGQDIRSVTQSSLRAAIGMVPQDTVLFNDTIRYNIAYGRWEAEDAEIEAAAAMAQIDRFIRDLPAGYDTQVGERGLKLSGGEKQRVAIARTILKGPPILVLDEATSALDSYTETEIQDALERVSAGRTTLVIAHRLSTVINADEIIVLDDGMVVERGDHAALIALGGVYAGLWNRQREADEARERLKRLAAEDRPRVSHPG
jgi:ATP-binding cassette subfamily B protein